MVVSHSLWFKNFVSNKDVQTGIDTEETGPHKGTGGGGGGGGQT
jgi:hypothetical protein